MDVDSATGAARKTERRLRQLLRHERLSVAMALAEFTHHTALRRPTVARAKESEMHYATGQMTPPPRAASTEYYRLDDDGDVLAARPTPLVEVRPQPGVQRHTAEQTLETFVFVPVLGGLLITVVPCLVMTLGADHDRRPLLLAPTAAEGTLAVAAWHSSGLGEVSRWLLRACRNWQSSAVAVGLVFICSIVEQATCGQWRCHRFSSSTSWGSSLGLCLCTDKLLMYQWSGTGRFPLLSGCLGGCGPHTFYVQSRAIHTIPSSSWFLAGTQPDVLAPVYGGFWKNFSLLVFMLAQFALGNLDATSTSLVGWSLPRNAWLHSGYMFLYSFRRLLLWHLWIGRARHPGPPSHVRHVGVEFHNVGGWLTHGDLAIRTGVDFLCCY